MSNPNSVGIVLGTGIKIDGTLPASSIACVKKVVELQTRNKIIEILLSSKYAWNLDYVPPTTEAKAMEKIAKENGARNVYLGEEGQTTVHNLCWIKQMFLKWHNYFDPVFVIASPILAERFEYNVKMVLGSDYQYKIVFADFEYPTENNIQLTQIEKNKLSDCIKFYDGIDPGDDQRIYESSLKDLQENYHKKL